MPGDLKACLEARLFGATFARSGYIVSSSQYGRTLSGYYNSLNSLVVDASRLRGVSGYLTLNPVNEALLSRADNELIKARHTTTDADILTLRWVYIDIDPVRPADISSTNEELAAALARRDAILADYPSIQDSSMWGCSGNGAFVFLRIDDLPNDDRHRGMIANLLDTLARRYSDSAVKIDTTTKNPARIACLPGTVKAKGSHRPERPWRLVRVDGKGRHL